MPGEPYFLGVDVGGTQMRMAPVTREGVLCAPVAAIPTGPGFSPDDLRRQIVALSAGLRGGLGGRRAEALGFGIAGVMTAGGPLTQSPHLPLLEGMDVAAVVREVADVPVTAENDARCFTLAEARFGAARGARDVCGLSLGTGVGCGVMVAGSLHRGAHAQAGEVWHIQLRGESVEAFVSGAGIVRGYAAAGGMTGQELSAREVAGRARAGDPAAQSAWRSFGDDLGFLCETIVGLLDPDVIVIGGSLSGARDLYGHALSARLAAHPTRVADALLGPSAGVVGAAALNIN